jgi:hypothetical protein
MNSNSCLEEYVSNIGDDNSGSKVIRYKHCKQILGWLSRVGSCIACQQTVRRNKRQYLELCSCHLLSSQRYCQVQ